MLQVIFWVILPGVEAGPAGDCSGKKGEVGEAGTADRRINAGQRLKALAQS